MLCDINGVLRARNSVGSLGMVSSIALLTYNFVNSGRLSSIALLACNVVISGKVRTLKTIHRAKADKSEREP